MNIWKEIDRNRIQPEDFIACVEISQGDKTKYELDKQTGFLIMDRILYTSTHYPMNYGFIPLTYCDDNDPLDVFVLCSQPLERLSLVRCYPIGVVMMIDGNQNDQKIIAIPYGDPEYNSFSDISQLPKHVFEELMHFLRVYKELENKVVDVKALGDREVAIKTIKDAMKLYERKILDN